MTPPRRKHEHACANFESLGMENFLTHGATEGSNGSGADGWSVLVTRTLNKNIQWVTEGGEKNLL